MEIMEKFGLSLCTNLLVSGITPFSSVIVKQGKTMFKNLT